MLQLTYKYRLYPNQQQTEQIEKTCHGVRYIYNKLLEDRTSYYRKTGKWKKLDRRSLGEPHFLDGVDPGALDWAQSRLEAAYRNFFYTEKTKPDKYRPDRILAAEEDLTYKLMDTDLVSYPKYKKKKTTKESYTTPLPEFNVIKSKVKLPGVGAVKIRYHRAVPEDARILSGTVLKNSAGNYFLLVKFYLPEVPAKKDLSVPLGVALAPGRLAVRSDGESVNYRHTDTELQKRIDRAYKSLKRRQPGSHRYEKQRKYLASLYEHRANQRRDDLHKAARQITNAADAVYMQQANVMEQLFQMKSPESRAMLLDEATWTFSYFVRYKLLLEGKWFWSVPKEGLIFSICSKCNKVQKMGQKGDWVCPACGVRMGLYENAAGNLENIARQYIRAKT